MPAMQAVGDINMAAYYRRRPRRLRPGRSSYRRRISRRLPGRLRSRRSARLSASPKRCGYRL